MGFLQLYCLWPKQITELRSISGLPCHRLLWITRQQENGLPIDHDRCRLWKDVRRGLFWVHGLCTCEDWKHKKWLSSQFPVQKPTRLKIHWKLDHRKNGARLLATQDTGKTSLLGNLLQMGVSSSPVPERGTSTAGKWVHWRENEKILQPNNPHWTLTYECIDTIFFFYFVNCPFNLRFYCLCWQFFLGFFLPVDCNWQTIET